MPGMDGVEVVRCPATARPHRRGVFVGPRLCLKPHFLTKPVTPRLYRTALHFLPLGRVL